MSWLLLVAYATVTFVIPVESPQQCVELARLSIAYAQESGQPKPVMACARTLRI